MEYLGTVKTIHRYPVKSMGGESLASATLRWPGIDGDRQYAFYRATNDSRFPWLTGREVSELVTYRARYLEPENPRRSAVQVSTPEQVYDVRDAALRERISRAAREEVRLLQVGRGTFDSMPVSVISTATASGLRERFGRAIDMRRFRTNIVVETPNGQAARETEWVGGTLIFGDETTGPRLRANVAIDRCAMITIDPETGARDPALLRGVVEDFNNEIGVRCATEATGTIAVGDPVRIVRS
ncbi:MAG: MOSC N-terminal beta barrel domain-containing protein [Stellaceae bacterium]